MEGGGGGDSVPDTTKIKLPAPMANAMALKHEIAIFFDIASINFSSDFVITSQSRLTFSAELTQYITLDIIDDFEDELAEKFFVNLINSMPVVGVVISPSRATITIIDNDEICECDHIHTHTHTLSLSLSLTHTHTHKFSNIHKCICSFIHSLTKTERLQQHFLLTHCAVIHTIVMC